MPELFFCRDFLGYGWVFRKGDYLNVGIGRRSNAGFGDHVRNFTTFLEKHGIVTGISIARWHGHAYLGSGLGSRPVLGQGAMLVGDAAGLAYPESGEGIRPAIESGRLAAETLIAAIKSESLWLVAGIAGLGVLYFLMLKLTAPKVEQQPQALEK